jgi:hypothetical protein
VLSQRLDIQFTDTRSHLGPWGHTDGEAKLGDHTRLLLEVENKQKHPSTNVLKVWPFLEENKGLSVLLVHAFFPDSPGLNSSRGQLASWLAQRLQELLGSRFVYCKIVIGRDSEPGEGFSELQAAILRCRGDVQPAAPEGRFAGKPASSP